MSSFPAANIFTKVLFIPEVTYNTLPTTPTMTGVPFVDCSLSTDITKVTDNTIQGDTMHRWVVPTTEKTAGTISGELMHTNADWFLQGIFYNTWTSNNLTVGIVQPSYSIEVGHTDINQYFQYSGMVLDKFALTFTAAGLVTFKADMIGSSYTSSSTTVATVTTAAPRTAPLSTVTATVKLNGAVVAYITGATMDFDRKTVPVYVLGSPLPNRMITSFFNATGTLDLQVVDAVAYGYFTANTACAIDWTLTDGTNTYEIQLPNLYLETFSMNVTGTGPVMAKANFTAVYDPTTNSTAKITRSS